MIDQLHLLFVFKIYTDAGGFNVLEAVLFCCLG